MRKTNLLWLKILIAYYHIKARFWDRIANYHWAKAKKQRLILESLYKTKYETKC